MFENQPYEEKLSEIIQKSQPEKFTEEIEGKNNCQNESPEFPSSENEKWEKIINENEKEDEKIPFLMQEKSFQSENKLQDYERQKSMMEETAKSGREYLVNKNYELASKELSKTLMAFEFIAKNYAQTIPKEYLKQMMIETVLPAHNNLALCYLKLKNFELVISLTNQVIGQDPSNAKARYRRGLAFKELKRTDEAIEDFEFVKKLDPEIAADCDQKIIECRKIEAEQRKRRKLSAQKFISGYQNESEKNEEIKQIETSSQEQKNTVTESVEKTGIMEWIKKKCEQCSKIFAKSSQSIKKEQ